MRLTHRSLEQVRDGNWFFYVSLRAPVHCVVSLRDRVPLPLQVRFLDEVRICSFSCI